MQIEAIYSVQCYSSGWMDRQTDGGIGKTSGRRVIDLIRGAVLCVAERQLCFVNGFLH